MIHGDTLTLHTDRGSVTATVVEVLHDRVHGDVVAGPVTVRCTYSSDAARPS